MENPWDSSPWTTSDLDTRIPYLPAELAPKLYPDPDPGTEFEKIHFAAFSGEESHLSSASPWDRVGHVAAEEAWGGWGEDLTRRKATASWELGREDLTTTATTTEIAAVTAAAVATLPDPWTGVEKTTPSSIHGGFTDDDDDDRNADSGIAMGEEERFAGDGEAAELAPLPGVVDEVDEGTCHGGTERGGCEDNQKAGLQEEDEESCASPGREQLVPAEDAAAQDERNRQVSKVQELVDMFDGMAKTRKKSLSVQLSLVATPLGGDTIAAAAEVNGDDGSGEEEGGGMHLERLDLGVDGKLDDAAGESPKDDGFSPAESAAAAAAAAEEDHETSVTRRSSSTTTTTLTTETTLPTALPYPIDLCNLDDLFPEPQPFLSTPSSTALERLPVTIINDSFTSVSQRKAWYRVSRPGSIRKHNLGDDDDNYVRVSWHNSHVRKEVLATVRRWMEEDSLGGRLLLGRRLGHQAGSTMFNWDSDAPGVQIGELLSQKKACAGHARQASAAVPGTVTSPVAASFGWSSSVPASPVDTGGFFSSTPERPARPSPLTLTQTTQAQTLENSSPTTTITSGTTPPRSPTLPDEAPSVDAGVAKNEDADADAEADEDEDDWGEMVSSPTADMVPAFNMEATTATTGAHALPPTVDTMRANSAPTAAYADTGEDATGLSSPLAPPPAEANTRPIQLSCMRNPPSLMELNPWNALDSLGRESAGMTRGASSASTGDSRALAPLPMSMGPVQGDCSSSTPADAGPGCLAAAAAAAITKTTAATTTRTAHRVDPFAMEQHRIDETVERLLRDLPDLSYMLR